MTDIDKVRRVEYKSHLLQVQTCKVLMDLMILRASEESANWNDQASVLRDLSVAVANVGGRVPQ